MDTDVLCLLCYKAHLKLLTELENDQENDINYCINHWLQEQNDINTSEVTKSVLEAVVFVANHLRQDKALLLSAASTVFAEHYTRETLTCSISSLSLTIETEESTLKFSSRWLLNNLIIHLNNFLNFKCIHQRYGMMLYRKNGDILTSLSWALGASNSSNQSTINIPKAVHPTVNKEREDMLRASALMINDILHDEIKCLSQLPEIPYMSIQDYLLKIDKNLLELATQSVRHRHFSKPQIVDKSKIFL